ncbi:hypothetical protein STTU_5263 [Streptomyces sp. Tu6071]|uniref:Secreted protein n=1 Tax=Streptomyces evansiae TaxID=3075535 RepID=A0ABD5E7R9_9ACTN|nr:MULTISPECIES: hypothetical protein [unclassified Streptomyces]ASY35382.1 hypothetical protein CAC01_24100 [Streptomyces sp. CLI2509]EGJ78052.1 hypothetical protein STTU_5263 [Streptomyces sp. Tu6071]MDT0417320.1 hypothetical protein [Streptomyces sp. DSM 41982]MYX20996.1 hypothetical protein [Streptomyces sp. SID8380]SCD33641.1 hypothetical protein GA0115246_100532 [Streptomyces sp. SolWspMP-sol7th]
MRLRTVAVSAVLVLSAGVTATACSSSDSGPASEGKPARTAVQPAAADPCAERYPDEKDCLVEMPADLEMGEARLASGPPPLDSRADASEGSPTPAPDPGFAEVEIGKPAGSEGPSLP